MTVAYLEARTTVLPADPFTGRTLGTAQKGTGEGAFCPSELCIGAVMSTIRLSEPCGRRCSNGAGLPNVAGRRLIIFVEEIVGSDP